MSTKKAAVKKALLKRPEIVEQTISICLDKSVLNRVGLCEFSIQAIGNVKRLLERANNGPIKNGVGMFDDVFSYEERVSGVIERKLAKFKKLFKKSAHVTLHVQEEKKRIKTIFRKRYRVTLRFSSTSSIVNMYYGTYKNDEEFIAMYSVELVNM